MERKKTAPWGAAPKLGKLSARVALRLPFTSWEDLLARRGYAGNFAYVMPEGPKEKTRSDKKVYVGRQRPW